MIMNPARIGRRQEMILLHLAFIIVAVRFSFPLPVRVLPP